MVKKIEKGKDKEELRNKQDVMETWVNDGTMQPKNNLT